MATSLPDSCSAFLHRARRLLLIAVSAYVLAHIFVWVAFLRYDWLRDPGICEQIRRLELRLARTPERPYLVIALGSSITFNGFCGREAEPILGAHLQRPIVVRSLSLPGGSPLDSLRSARRLHAHGIHPDLFLLELSPLTCAGDREETPDPMERVRPWHDYLVPAWYTYRSELLYRYFPFLAGYKIRPAYMLRADNWGWIPHVGAITEEQRACALKETRRFFEVSLQNLHLSPQVKSWARTLCSEAQMQGTQVILVRPPEGPTIRSLYSPSATALMNEWVTELEREQHVPCINAREWFYEETPFIDSFHFHIEGSIPYTRRLVADHLLPRLDTGGKLR
jgi:hypothetical protein